MTVPSLKSGGHVPPCNYATDYWVLQIKLGGFAHMLSFTYQHSQNCEDI